MLAVLRVIYFFGLLFFLWVKIVLDDQTEGFMCVPNYVFNFSLFVMCLKVAIYPSFLKVKVNIPTKSMWHTNKGHLGMAISLAPDGYKNQTDRV